MQHLRSLRGISESLPSIDQGIYKGVSKSGPNITSSNSMQSTGAEAGGHSRASGMPAGFILDACSAGGGGGKGGGVGRDGKQGYGQVEETTWPNSLMGMSFSSNSLIGMSSSSPAHAAYEASYSPHSRQPSDSHAMRYESHAMRHMRGISEPVMGAQSSGGRRHDGGRDDQHNCSMLASTTYQPQNESALRRHKQHSHEVVAPIRTFNPGSSRRQYHNYPHSTSSVTAPSAQNGWGGGIPRNNTSGLRGVRQPSHLSVLPSQSGEGVGYSTLRSPDRTPAFYWEPARLHSTPDKPRASTSNEDWGAELYRPSSSTPMRGPRAYYAANQFHTHDAPLSSQYGGAAAVPGRGGGLGESRHDRGDASRGMSLPPQTSTWTNLSAAGIGGVRRAVSRPTAVFSSDFYVTIQTGLC